MYYTVYGYNNDLVKRYSSGFQIIVLGRLKSWMLIIQISTHSQINHTHNNIILIGKHIT